MDQPHSTAVKPIPDGMHSLTPHLICADAVQAIGFYQRAFNAVELSRLLMPNGKLMHATLRIGDSALMLVDENPDWGAIGPAGLKSSPVSIHLYVEDVDAAFAQAVAAGRPGQDAAGRHVLGRPLLRHHRSLRPQLDHRHPHPRRQPRAGAGGVDVQRGRRLTAASGKEAGTAAPRLVGMLDSPYVRRVAIALDVLGLPFEHQSLSVFSTFEQFRAINPVVKAPTLVCADGSVLMDSSLILQYLEADSTVALWPPDPVQRRAAFAAVGLALAACEKGAQLVYERQLRPADKQFEPWCARVLAQMLAAWSALEQQVASNGALFADARQHPAMCTAVVWEFTQSMLAAQVDAASYPAIAALVGAAGGQSPFPEISASGAGGAGAGNVSLMWRVLTVLLLAGV